MKNKKWDQVIDLRGKTFLRNWETYKMLKKSIIEQNDENTQRLAVIQTGESSPGINASVLSFVRYVISEGHIVFGIFDGINGLIDGKFKHMKWSDVIGYTSSSGSKLGTSDTLPEKDMKCVAKQLKEHNINGLLVIGGFLAFRIVIQLIESRNKFNELKIPICIIPATIDNNIPGTDFSLGTDSALNKITKLCTDKVLSSLGLNFCFIVFNNFRKFNVKYFLIYSKGTKRRLFIVKLENGFCGYLTTMSAM